MPPPRPLFLFSIGPATLSGRGADLSNDWSAIDLRGQCPIILFPFRPSLAASRHQFCHLCDEDGVRGARGVHAMADGDAAYAMAIESAAIAFAACDRRLGPQLS